MIRIPEVNVWFVLFFLAIGIVIVFRLPPRLPKSVSALMMLWSLAVPLVMDHTIGSPPIDAYDTNINPALTFSDVLTWGMYPVFGYIFVYIYDKWGVKGLGIPLYVLGWAILGAAFEALSVRFDVFQYKKWSTYYSFLVYVVVQLLTVILYNVLKKVFIRTREV